MEEFHESSVVLPLGKYHSTSTIASSRLRLAAVRGAVYPQSCRPNSSTAELCTRENCSVRQVNMAISLAFLAPNPVKAAVEGRLPRGIGIERLRDPPTDWKCPRFFGLREKGDRLDAGGRS